MTRISKQAEKRSRSPRRRQKPSQKTGPLKENLSLGYKPHANALDGSVSMFIPKIK